MTIGRAVPAVGADAGVAIVNPAQSVVVQELKNLQREVRLLRRSVEGQEQEPSGMLEVFHRDVQTVVSTIRLHVSKWLLTTENAAAATFELWVGSHRVWAERMPGNMSVERELELTIEQGSNIEIRGGVAADVAMSALVYTPEHGREEQGRADLSSDH